MSVQEACPGCQRAVIDVRSPVHACDESANGTPQRCAWRALQQQAAFTSAPWPDEPSDESPAAASSAAGRDEAASKTPPPADLATALQQLADERAARQTLREQLRITEAVAAEAQALRARLSDELERKKTELARLRNVVPGAGAAAPLAAAPAGSAGLPPDRPPAPPRRGGSAIGLLALGALAGLAIGAGSVSWLRTLQPLVAMQMDETTLASQPGPVVAEAAKASAPVALVALVAASPVSVASAASDTVVAAASAVPAPVPLDVPAPPVVASMPDASASSVDLPTRLQATLALEGVAGTTVDVGPDARTVSVADPAANREARDKTDTIIRAVFAGAQLPEPRIEHRWVSPTHADRLASMRHESGVAPPVLVAAARQRADDSRSMTLGTPAAAKRAESAAPAPALDARPAVLPFGRLTAACNDRASREPLVRKSSVMSQCMRQTCCDAAHARTEECQAFDRSYPLNCPR